MNSLNDFMFWLEAVIPMQYEVKVDLDHGTATASYDKMAIDVTVVAEEKQGVLFVTSESRCGSRSFEYTYACASGEERATAHLILDDIKMVTAH